MIKYFVSDSEKKRKHVNAITIIYSLNICVARFFYSIIIPKIMYFRSSKVFLIINSVFLLFITVQGRTITTNNYPLATTDPFQLTTNYPLSRYERGLEDYEEEQTRLHGDARGMMYDDHHEEMSSSKAVKNDPWQGYFDFLINEGSWKFWAVFQVVTAAILIYSAFAAVYYAKYNFVQADYDYSDYFLGRSASGTASSSQWNGLGVETFLRILDAISSKKYS